MDFLLLSFISEASEIANDFDNPTLPIWLPIIADFPTGNRLGISYC